MHPVRGAIKGLYGYGRALYSRFPAYSVAGAYIFFSAGSLSPNVCRLCRLAVCFSYIQFEERRLLVSYWVDHFKNPRSFIRSLNLFWAVVAPMRFSLGALYSRLFFFLRRTVQGVSDIVTVISRVVAADFTAGCFPRPVYRQGMLCPRTIPVLQVLPVMWAHGPAWKALHPVLVRMCRDLQIAAVVAVISSSVPLITRCVWLG